jgi:hypothetical protein
MIKMSNHDTASIGGDAVGDAGGVVFADGLFIEG